MGETVPIRVGEAVPIAIELFAPIDKRWKALGGKSWGIPANSGHTRPDGTIVVDFKTHPAAVATKSICYKAGIGAYVLIGAIRTAWQQFRGGNLGAPTADAQPTHDGAGRYQVFEHCVYVWHPNTGAHEVQGAIRQRYNQLGGSAWGFPITDETAPDKRGRFNHFKDVATGAEKSIYWTPQTGAHEVFGAIRQAWAALKWETGVLGYPTSGEMATHDGVGRFQTFERGILVWHPTTGAFEVHGAILERYYQLGGTRWGYPITNEGAAGSGRFNHFREVASGAEKSIYWTQATGPVEVSGAHPQSLGRHALAILRPGLSCEAGDGLAGGRQRLAPAAVPGRPDPVSGAGQAHGSRAHPLPTQEGQWERVPLRRQNRSPLRRDDSLLRKGAERVASERPRV